jgi:hypothetical protein
LKITAKMGASQRSYVSFAGRRLQTRFFKVNDADWLAANLNAANILVQDAIRYGNRDKSDHAQIIRDVPVTHVKAFLESYQVHPDSPDLDGEMMIKYIDKQLEADTPSLRQWTIAVVIGDHEEIQLGGLSIRTQVRSQLNDGDPMRADIKTLMSKEDRVLDLNVTSLEARAMPEQKLVQLREKDHVYSTRGLLVLYPIEAHSAPAGPPRIRLGDGQAVRVPLNAVQTVVGLGMVFPGAAAERNRVRDAYVAVDLSDVEREDIDEALDNDTEDGSE